MDRRLKTAGDGSPSQERRTIRLVLVLVALGWAAALGLMAFAAAYWDHASA